MNSECVWSIAPFVLHLDCDGESYTLREQADNGDLLYSLAQAGCDGVGECALHIICKCGFAATDIYDALAAYSEAPLAEPGQEYLRAFHDVDWSQTFQTAQLLAILLSGEGDAPNRALLPKILHTVAEDFRDGPLYAASSVYDERYVCKFAELAMTSHGGPHEADGLALGFRRWLRREQVTEDAVYKRLKEHERPNREYWSAERFMNLIACPRFESIPYPREVPDAE